MSYFSFRFPAIQLFISTWEKSYEDMSSSSTCFRYYRKYSNNDNKIYPLASACFQQHFYDWFVVRKHIQKQPEWTPPLLNSIKFMICQIDENCSLFQSLKMLPFHIKPKSLKLTYYSLIWNFSRYYLKIGLLCLIF